MASLLLEDSTSYSNLGEIAREHTALKIQVRHFNPGTALLFPSLEDTVPSSSTAVLATK